MLKSGAGAVEVNTSVLTTDQKENRTPLGTEVEQVSQLLLILSGSAVVAVETVGGQEPGERESGEYERVRDAKSILKGIATDENGQGEWLGWN